MISTDEALNTILARVKVLETEEVPILKSLDRVLAEDIVATNSIPAFDNSAMDGYALQADDTEGASPDSPAKLTVLQDLPAGHLPTSPVTSGEAIRIMTGAPMPEGADAVVMVEYTQAADGHVSIMREAKNGDHVRRAGEELNTGDVAIASGKVINPADIGLLGAVGVVRVKVVRQPVVSILATGDEIVDISQDLVPGKIRNSNSYALAAQVLRIGAVPKIVGIAQDREEDVREKIRQGLNGDVLLTIGGVSVGDFDLVKGILNELGEMIIWKVAMKPGKPLAFGIIEGKLVFGLPGNPTSAMVTFEQFVRPALLRMAGREKLKKPEVEAYITDNIHKKPGRKHFIRVKVDRKEGRYFASVTGPQGSGMLKSMSLADGLLVLPEDVTEVIAGDPVLIQMMDWPETE